MSKKPKTAEAPIVVTANDILTEVNGIALALNLRLAGLDEDQKRTTRSAQLIAMGALWMKFLTEAGETDAASCTEVAEELSRKLTLTPLS